MALLDESQRLDKELGLFDVFAVSMGAMLSSGFFLLPGLAAARTGPSVILAYFLAGVLMIPAMLSKAELSTAMPRAGGTYYFIDRSLGPLAGTVGGIGTWLVMTLKSAFALIGMGAYLALVLELPIRPVALVLTATFAVLNVLGVKQTVGLQSTLVLFVLAVMALFVGEGTLDLFQGDPLATASGELTPFFTHGLDGLFGTVGFVVISYAGLTKVASVSEEVREPEKNIPLGMILSLCTATLLYVVGVFIMIAFLSPEQLRGDLTPVATAAGAFMTWIPRPWGVTLVSVAAIAGFAAAGNAALMSASRYPLAMARDHLAPEPFSRLQPRLGTPVLSVLLTAGLMATFILTVSEEGVAKLASSVQLLLFGLVCLAVIVMRESRIESYDPGFRSPLYPWTQIAGAAASLWLIVEIGLMSILFALGVIGVSIAWFFAYGRRRVSRGGALLHVFSRLGQSRFEGLDPELRSIMKEKGLRIEDPFDEVVARAFVVEAEPGESFEDLADHAGALLATRLPAAGSDIALGLLEGTRVGATPVSRGAALPHTRIPGAEHPELVVARSREGLELGATPPGTPGEARVHAVFFLASPEGNPGQHLRLLAEIAGRVDDETFLDQWLAARHHAALKEVLLRDERFFLLRVEEGTATEALADRPLREIDLPQGCLVALVRHRDRGTIVPDGSTIIRLGDRLTVLGEPEGIATLDERYGRHMEPA